MYRINNRLLPFSRRLIVGLGLLAACLLSTAVAGAQDIPLPEQEAPPPLHVIPQSDRAQLEAERGLKDRVKVSAQLLDSHLLQADQFTNSSHFDEAAAEFGIYYAIVENTLQFLAEAGERGNKSRDAYKRFELALRSHAPRIESIRRMTPREYSSNVKRVADYARDARSEALNAFYGDTVLREPRQSNQKPDKTRSDGTRGPSSQDNQP
jgi:hypothetical protein